MGGLGPTLRVLRFTILATDTALGMVEAPAPIVEQNRTLRASWLSIQTVFIRPRLNFVHAISRQPQQTNS